MAETVRSHVVKAHFDHELGLERLPSVFLPAIPTTRPARGIPSESGCLDQPLQLFGQLESIGGGDAGGEANVMKQSFRVVQAKQERAHHFTAGGVAKSA